LSDNNQVSNQQQKRIVGKESARIVLASGSPRRLELLTNLGLNFEVIASQVEETVPPGITPEELVRTLAGEKAHDVLKRLSKEQDTVVIGADTMVVLDGELIGKPEDEEDAKRMLRRLSARTHTVFTGVVVLKQQKHDDLKTFEHVESSLVTFRKLDETEITAYVATREPLDKAGAYALQGVGAALVARVEGCYTNIIGLPVPNIVSMLRQAGVNILGLPDCQDSI
jgi:septum formation protein